MRNHFSSSRLGALMVVVFAVTVSFKWISVTHCATPLGIFATQKSFHSVIKKHVNNA